MWSASKMNRSPFAPSCGSKATLPIGNVAAMASNAAAVIEMRIGTPQIMVRDRQNTPYGSMTPFDPVRDASL
jgi:hypothetical protein